MDSIENFDASNNNLRECFIDMGSFLKDQKIIASTIIDLWSGLYSKEDIICRNHLQDLASHNLLKLLPLGKNEYGDCFYNELLVKQDNVSREFAMHQCEKESVSILQRKRLNMDIQENKFPNWCLNLKQPIVLNASLLSISTDDSFTSCWVEMHCPDVEVLVLNLCSSNYALPNFNATMKKLKVVMIMNHGLEPTKLTNLSCLSSLPYLRRIRFEKGSITLHDIPKLELNNLEKLSLWLCHFDEPLNESEFDGNLRNLEMLRVVSCSSLFELPETIKILSNLRFLDVSGCFQLKRLPLEIGKLQKLKKISMRDCYRCELPDSVKNLENLEVKCDEGTVFLWVGFKPKMKNLIITEEEAEHNLNLLQLF
ncbi:BnaC02g16520D [Brassica napus]|uniref:NB-ARC domain-containing protein n=2 Tax=Brassica TaxID=3705 RepID=A0A0D3AYV4_BRAOL|nr:unnamed protein product [Brassica napus]CDY43555.1 BnaC02g16520D [Brassica napus]